MARPTEALAALAAEAAAGHQLFQQRRRGVAAFGELPVQAPQDGPGDVEPDGVEQGERPHRVTQALFEGDVDPLDVDVVTVPSVEQAEGGALVLRAEAGPRG